MHYYPHHIGDFIADTARLNDSQCMAYLRLIWMYYDTEKPLENDPESLAFKIGASLSDVNLILKHYFILDGDSWRKTRCDAVLSEYHSKADKARKSAESRWKNAKAKQPDSERNANASNIDANASKNDANQEPITNNQKPYKDSASQSSKTRSTLLADEIMDLFNAIVTSAPAVVAKTKTRRNSIARICHENPNMQSIEKWKEFFEYVCKSDFLCGRQENHLKGFGFDWIFKDDNFVKIIEGNYHDE